MASSAAAPIFIVLNSGSGCEDTTSTSATIRDILDKAGREHRLMRVDDGRRLHAVAREAVDAARDRAGIVVAGGGDGTINAVARALMERGGVLGVLPHGTFNYFGRAHGIPEDIGEATRLLLHGEPQPVQVGLVNDRVFLVSASMGLYPQLLEDREAYKRRYGRRRLVALWAALVTLLHAHRPLRLELDSRGVLQRVRTPTLFVGNNALQLEQIGIPGVAALSQGSLVAITLRPVGTLAMLWLMLRGAFGQLGQAREVFSFPFERLKVRPAPPFGGRLVKVATDGEVLALRAPLVFRVAPEPLMLIKPAQGGMQAPPA